MQKKLIALAVAGAFVAPAAFADSGNVTIYGNVDMSYDIVNNGEVDSANQALNAKAKSIRAQGINSNSSYIGFKGSEDLGNGLSAIWQVESLINPDGTNTPATANPNMFSSRNSFVGLSGKSWGTFLMGKHDTPYKLSTRSLDVFGNGIADNRSIMGGAGTFDGRNANTMAYITPAMNGFTGAVGYVLLNENNNAAAGLNNLFNNAGNGAGSDITQSKAWSLMGMYTNGPWLASLAFERHNFGHDGTSPATGLMDAHRQAWKLGVGYSANNFSVGLAYEKLTDDLNKNNLAGASCNQVGGSNTTPNNVAYTGNECSGNANWYLSGKYNFGNNVLKAAYTHAGDRSTGSETGARQWSLGLDHNFSKRTTIYALYTKLDNDKYATYAIGSATSNGAYTVSNNPSGVAGTNAGGASQDAWSFGIKHSF